MPEESVKKAQAPVSTGATPKAPSQAFGTVGLRQYSGILDEEFLRELKGRLGYEKYREMSENSPVLGGCLLAVKQLIRRTPLFVEPYDDSPDHLERAEFVEQSLNDMDQPFTVVMGDILTMMPFGWSLLEQTYKKRGESNSKFPDGKIGWAEWSPRSQETLDHWEIDDHGHILGFWQSDPYFKGGLVLIPANKYLLFRSDPTKNNPEGRSVLRNAYLPYYFAKRTMEILGIGMERDLSGLPVMYAPQEITAVDATGDALTTRTALERVLHNLRRGHQEGLLMPCVYDENGNKMYDFELVTTGGQRQFDVPKILELFNRLQAMPMLADFILIGHEAVGSFALSSSKTELFATALAGWLESILEIINEHALPRLFRMNGWPSSEVPQLKHGDIETADLKELSEFLKAYIGAGGLLDDELDEHLRKQADWPILPEGLTAANEEKEPPPGLVPAALEAAPPPPPPGGGAAPPPTEQPPAPPPAKPAAKPKSEK